MTSNHPLSLELLALQITAQIRPQLHKMKTTSTPVTQKLWTTMPPRRLMLYRWIEKKDYNSE